MFWERIHPAHVWGEDTLKVDDCADKLSDMIVLIGCVTMTKAGGPKSQWTSYANVPLQCSRKGMEKSYGIGSLPALLHFSDGIPVLFHGDLGEYGEVLDWILGNLEATNVEEVTAPILEMLIETNDNLAVVFYEHDGDQQQGRDSIEKSSFQASSGASFQAKTQAR